MQDSYGNTALHMAVLHRQTWMYDWLCKEADADIMKMNVLGLTALSLAAQCNKANMFQHVKT